MQISNYLSKEINQGESKTGSVGKPLPGLV
jgi:hypothetical protein